VASRKARAAAWCLLIVLALVSTLDARIVAVATSNLSNAAFDRAHDSTPWQFGIPARNVTIPSDGVALAGWWMPGLAGSPNATATVVLVHGYSTQMGKAVRHWAPNLHAAGYSLLAIDLRNHGASGNTTPPFVTYGVDESRDVLAAVASVRAHASGLGVSSDRIGLYGESMGAVSVLLAAATHPAGVRAVVADSAYASFRYEARLDGAKQGYPPAVIDWVVADMDRMAPSPPTQADAATAVKDVQVPLLLAHCTDDARLPDSSFDLILANVGTATVWHQPCPRGDSKDHHADGWANAGYNATVDAFLASALR